MDHETFHPLLIAVLLAVAAPAAPALAQAPDTTAQASDTTEGEPFTRRYIDARARRSSRVLLRDWRELTELLAWTRELEAAVAEEDRTLSAELIGEFRSRVTTLGVGPIPDFLESRRDSVRAALASIGDRLDRAEEALEAEPATVRPEEGEAPNAADRKRTLVTGKTAVTVPAGVAVGEADTLPRAAVEGGEPTNYVDFVALALADLDRLVHLVRKADAPVNGPPATSGRSP